MAGIEWTIGAQNQREDALGYCLEKFGIKVAIDFNRLLEKQVLLLCSNPNLGKLEFLLKNRIFIYRSLVIHKNYKLIYRVEEDTDMIVIVALWDVRREPRSLTDHIG